MSVLDVAAYVLKAQGDMTAMKLQKLCYYAQAWSLVWDERPMFPERIEAWANGPVAPALYAAHRGKFTVSPGDIQGDPDALDKDARETVDAVLRFYGDKPAKWLSDLTHSERPWMEAREGLDLGDRSNRVISCAAMGEYYGSL